MRNVVIFLFLFFTLLFTGQVNAQTPSAPTCPIVPTLAIPIPGMNCGNSADVCNNKCCSNGVEDKEFQKDIPFIGDALKYFNLESPRYTLWKYKTGVAVDPCSSGIPSTPGDLQNSGCICVKPTNVPLNTLLGMCENISDGNEKIRCENCLKGWGQTVGVWTGVGCVRADIGSFIQETLLGWGIGLAGGISMLCIMYAAFMMQTSGGEAEKIKKAQQLMTSCITGLMLIIFSVFILQLIGVRILRIPRFN